MTGQHPEINPAELGMKSACSHGDICQIVSERGITGLHSGVQIWKVTRAKK